ncbi:MAG: hypothetical protein IH598_12585 [Bacteroidales bacterium]|nr:hypothetical protein [Bacteroidales bacterium]
MIINLFRTRYFGQYVALLVFAVLLRIDGILDHGMFSESPPGFRLEVLNELATGFPLFSAILMALLLLIQAYFLNQVLENNRLTPLNQLLPAALYILMMSSGVVLLQPNAMMIVNLIMIIMLNIIFNFYGDQSPKSRAFDAGMMVGLASLLYFPVIWFVVFIWFSFLIYQNLTFRNFLISTIGATIPMLFAGVYFFWTDQFTMAFSRFSLHFTDIKPLLFKMDIYVIIIWSLFAMLFITGFSEVLRRITSNAIEIRRKFRVLVFFFLFALVTAIFAGSDLKFHLMLALIPLSSFLTAYLSHTKKLVLPEIIIALILIAIFAGKFINLM